MLALATMVILTLVVTSFSLRLDSHIKSESSRIDRRKTELAIQAGLSRAMASLVDANINVTTTSDEWFNLGETGSIAFTVADSSVRIQIIDTTRFVNLNTATEEQLVQLNFTENQVAAILDWREDQLQPRQLGAKDEYYNTLTTPYNVKLRRFDSVSELLLVRDFTPADVLFPPQNNGGNALLTGNIEDQPAPIDILTIESRSPNRRQDGTERVNLNIAQNPQLVQAGISNQAAQAIIQRRNTQGQFTSLNQVFAVNGLNLQDAEVILNVATISAENFLNGKINVNTAPEAVLRTIPEITDDQVQGILTRQGSFEQLGDITEVPGISTNTLQQLADFLTIGSQTFLIRLEGRRGPARSYAEAIVNIVDGQPRLLQLNRPIERDPLTRWGWEIDPLSDQSLLEEPN